ncbi:MAG: endolytic transglycosylase MltG [Myxococcota bacterium]|nr:endolytic transglycosylase MltG [Myxococcota bacterium]
MNGRHLAGAAILAAVLATGGALLLARAALEPVAPGSVQTAIFTIAPGEPVGGVATRLKRDGLLKSALAFRLLARWRDLERDLQVGEFELSPAMTPGELLDRIVSGQVVTYEVVIPEGFTLAQIADRLAEAGVVDRDAFLAVARAPETAQALRVEGDGLEGYLFPETYRIPRGLSARAVARTLVQEFHRAWAEIAPLARERDFSMRETVTLASIVEKETGAPQERPLIASVFWNRLNRSMRLETDPTVIYGIADFDGNLRRRHLEDRTNPYNTYVISGLPPGPIASPGRAALRAVVEPAESDYLFFVSKNDGTHVFSQTYRDHKRAVDRYQRRGRRRQ